MADSPKDDTKDQVARATHVFELEDREDTTSNPTYAFVHGLGTVDLHVSARDRLGKAVEVSSVPQDDNIMVVTKTTGSWSHGDRITLMG
jgi:hypothetical protein